MSTFLKAIKKSTASRDLWIYVPFLLLLIAIKIQNKATISEVVIDVFTVADIPAYTGFVSNIGILIWCFSFAVGIFTYLTLKRERVLRRLAPFWLYSSSLSFLFLCDDFFLLHERFFNTYFRISEKLVMIAYIAFLIVYLIQFRRIILESRFLFMFLFLFFLGLSQSLDFLEPILFSDLGLKTHDNYRLLEEGTKLLGIVSWGMYMLRAALDTMQKMVLKKS